MYFVGVEKSFAKWHIIISGTSGARPKMLHALRRGASVFRASMPKIKDVNVIDKYSRVIFPVSFMIFNGIYWVFYVIEWTDKQIKKDLLTLLLSYDNFFNLSGSPADLFSQLYH